MSFILGKKLKMTQVWKEKTVVPVTVILAQPNKVTIVRTKERDGYEAVQVALGKRKKEFRKRNNDHNNDYDKKIGDTVNVSVFAEGDRVKVTGTSKGRGFQGGVKRHGFHGGPKTHGQKNRFRAPGSIGSTAPQRVLPGRKMAGHMGNVRVSLKNVSVVGVDPEKNILLLKGAVPGATGGLLEISKIKSQKSK